MGTGLGNGARYSAEYMPLDALLKVCGTQKKSQKQGSQKMKRGESHLLLSTLLKEDEEAF